MKNEQKQLGWREPALVLAVLLIASLFRLYGFDKVPPAFNGDEANLALDAQSILQGEFFLIGPNEGTSGAFWLYLLAGIFGIFGVSIATARGLSVVVSMAGLLAAYFLVRYLLTPALTRAQAITIALLVALYLAVTRWYVEFSRIAFSANLAVLVQVAFFIALWWALRTRRVLPAITAGLLLGLTGYTYVPLRFTPLLVLFFFLIDGTLRWRKGAFIRSHFKTLVSIAGVGGILYAPLLMTYLTSGLGNKTRTFTFVNPVISHGDPWGTLIQSLQGNLAGFIPFVSHLGSVPIAKGVDNLSLLLFVIGLGIALWRYRRPEFLFLAVWWSFMLVPSIIAPEGAMPHLRRAIGAAIPTFTLIGLGLVIPLAALNRRRPGWRYGTVIAGAAVALFSLITLGRQTYTRYYLANLSEAAKLVNHIYDFELSDVMAAEGDSATGYILPVDTAAGAIFPESSTLAFLYQGRGQADYRYIWDDETTLFNDMQQFQTDNRRIGVIDWKVSKHSGADPRHIFDYILERRGAYQSSVEHQYFNIDYYILDEQTAPNVMPAPLTPADIPFEEQLTLTGMAWAGSAAAGDYLWAELSWRKTGESKTDYQVALWLEDDAGYEVGRVDRPLLNNLRHRGTGEWPPEAVERDYYLLQIDPAAAPGAYRLKAVVYYLTEQGDRRLTPSLPNVASDLAVALGEVSVLPAQAQVDVTALPISQMFDVALDDGLRLIGTDFPAEVSARPGDRKTFSLWWQADRPPEIDWMVDIELEQAGRVWTLAQGQPLGGMNYPTHNWPAKTVIRDFVDIVFPADIESGAYNLRLLFRPANQLERPAVSNWLLGQVAVSGRPRNFEIPSMAHNLEADFAGQIRLLGYNVSRDSEQMEITLYWQAQQEMETPYKVFTHLLDANGAIIAQMDREPQAGEAPTTSWLPGEVVIDQFTISTPDPTQVEQIIVGLYNPADGSRLTVTETGADSLPLEVEN